MNNLLEYREDMQTMARQKASGATAHHEAGHTVATWLVGYASAIERVSIIPTEDFLGVLRGGSPLTNMDLECDTSPEVLEALENAVVILYAGPAAQRQYRPRSWRHHHGAKDIRDAINLVGRCSGSLEDEEALHKKLYEQAKQLMQENWKEVEAVAKALLERRKLTGEEVTRLLETLTGKVVPRSSLFDYVDFNSINPFERLTEA